ncbi:MAG: HAD family hydrolase, partial [Candidatus Heimdallarchaeota archaeon]
EYERKGMENITIDQDVLTMLNSMKSFKIETALLTNNACNPTVEVLKKFNMIDYFSIIVAREDVKKMKPDKEGIDLILSKMNLHPNEVIFIGDSWVDARAANKAGVPFVLIRNDLLDTQKYDITIWKHIRSMTELGQIIEK